MNELHSDARLGGTWSWEVDEDDVYFEDRSEQLRDEGRRSRGGWTSAEQG